MLLGPLLLLTILTSAEVRVSHRSPGDERGFNVRDLMRYHRALEAERISNKKIMKMNIDAILKSPANLRSPSMDKRHLNVGWNSEPGKEETIAWTYGALHDFMVTH